MERNIITQILLSKDWPTKCFWCILSVSHTDCACEAKPENHHFQLKIQKVLHDLSHDVTNSVTALGMRKLWHFALTPEDAHTGLGNLLPHTFPAVSGHEPHLYSYCTHQTWGNSANNENEMILQIVNMNFQQLVLSLLTDWIHGRPSLITTSIN